MFSTPFQRAEEEKQSVLEKHVKLSNNEIQSGKKVCYNFKKGKCRLGSKCKYSHGSPIINKATDKTVKNVTSYPTLGGGYQEANPQYGDFKGDDDSYMESKKRKKRAGLAGGLVPPKKAMKSLDKLRQEERPWTVQDS